MSKLLTTGQMIDRLKPGEVAESKNRKAYYDSNCQLIEESKATGEKRPFTIWSGDKSPIWRIIPRYVSFEEAKEAFKQGKTICCYIENKKITYSPDGVDIYSQVDAPSWYEIFEGEWTIED
jgi:hypothetical protein